MTKRSPRTGRSAKRLASPLSTFDFRVAKGWGLSPTKPGRGIEGSATAHPTRKVKFDSALD
jgi:hypothetical protein